MMKASLDHLPIYKQQKLKAIAEAIQRLFTDVQFIILFGSHARDDYVDHGMREGPHFPYRSDFDILVITENSVSATRIEHSDELDNMLGQITDIPVTIIAHDIGYVNRRLKQGQYFFSDLKKEGIALYDSGNTTLAKPLKLDPSKCQQFAQEHFDRWFNSAVEFHKFFKFGLKEKHYNKAAFLLHQATENLFVTILLVFTRYKPRTHNLKKLNEQVNHLHPALKTIFPRKTEEEKRLFELLRTAYVDARYKKDYVITPDELSILQAEVDKLTKITEKICQEKIASFTEKANLSDTDDQGN